MVVCVGHSSTLLHASWRGSGTVWAVEERTGQWDPEHAGGQGARCTPQGVTQVRNGGARGEVSSFVPRPRGRRERFPSSLYKARWGRRVLTLPPFCTGIWWSPWTHFEQSLRRSNRQTLALTQTRSSATLMMSCLSASHDFSCNSFRVIICSLFCKCVCIWVHLFVQLQQACSDYLWIKIS